jgi:glycosyltransferase involved in cell wall biosynthesis
MRILIAHSWNLVMSGDNRVVEEEAKLLRGAGHQVRTWTPKPEDTSGLGAVRTGARAIWSSSAAATIRRFFRQDGTEVLHAHNLWPNLSPVIFRVAAADGVPSVMTVHNYRLASCLPATFLRDGRVCEDCLGRLPWRGVMHRCYRDSYLGSAVMAGSLTLHRAMKSFEDVSRFVAVSSFVRDKLVESGMSRDAIGVKPNFAWPAERRSGPGDYFLYLGRLYFEKAVDTILEAWRHARGRLLIVGDGPDAQRLRGLAPPGVEFVGVVAPDRVNEILRGARALLMPSRWYEAAPRAIPEAFAAGVPVVASDFGALPESVEDGVSGLLVPPDAPSEWAAAASRLQDDAESERLGEGAWLAWRDRYSPERGLEQLESIYRQVLADRPKGSGHRGA